MSVNRQVIVGNVGQEPAVSYTQGGLCMLKFSVATSYKPKSGQEETTWHNVVFFGKVAEIFGEMVKKGMKVYVEGRTQRHQSKSNQQWYSSIRGNHIELMSGANAGKSGVDRSDDAGYIPQEPDYTSGHPYDNDMGGGGATGSDVPF